MKKYFWFFTPVALLIDVFALNLIFEMISDSSDVSVLFGVVFLCALVAANFFIIQFISKKQKNEKNNS